MPMTDEQTVRLDLGAFELLGTLAVPDGARGVVLFAHGSGSSRTSPRNRFVAAALNQRGFATLLLDLLTAQEELLDARTAELRFDIELLARRLSIATAWAEHADTLGDLPVGYFGASTGAAAALIAASTHPEIRAVVSRGGRPDLAGDALARVQAPTLLIVGGDDVPVIGLNRGALARLTAPAHLEIVPGAGHLFEEPGALEHVARLAGDWFTQYLATPADQATRRAG
jgi:putative phosphoribosyl transferase